MNEEDVRKLINKNEAEVNVAEKLELIEKYILDLKSQTVKINRPYDIFQESLMQHGFNTAKAYYLDKLK